MATFEPVQVVFTAKDYIEGLKALPWTIKSYYNNNFPQNLLYNQGDGTFSGDCWNSIVKAYLWGRGVLPRNRGGYWFNPGRFGLGDWNGRQILDHCRDISVDFGKIAPAEYMLTKAEDHAGVYVGEFKHDGFTYNTIECTPIWANGIQATYTDEQGRRFQTKGGQQAGSWYYHAKMPWIDYGDEQLTYDIKTEDNTMTINFNGKGTVKIIIA